MLFCIGFEHKYIVIKATELGESLFLISMLNFKIALIDISIKVVIMRIFMAIWN